MQTVRVDQLAEVLAQAVRDGMRLEQERIIKLLDDRKRQHTQLVTMRPNRSDDQINHTICRTLESAVSLIKGGNNAA